MSNENDDLLKTAQTGHPGGRTSFAQSNSVGHTVTIGTTRSGKTWFMESLLESRKVNSRAAVRAAQPSAPYYRQFDKRRK